ncbi:hypothetical protein MACK_003612 [Theileria orientalis]|uniref:ABC transporter n=1 Tax=Theileria orientalis TaxID=68886 RepID=A0A976SJE1_THEOR|nr:hypothetical protein MACK_003612 [Theileria orientalis]
MSIKSFGVSYVSFKRMGKYINDCSPNFYITGNPYTGSVKTSSNIVPITTQLPNDTVVYYRDATFTWVHTRDDLLNKKYEPYLKNVNFELKRGGMAIVTGAQGSGKSNFIKSMLGEMTLVGGSMAVVPLYTSMPIFYASQDIFLQRGTIRSNITFGYKFDENIYNSVLKAVELEFDISTWEKGDLREVSDNAHTLSGGQRVRMELARAVYAYLVFHKVNKEYNNSKCSFLMCLDASFHGLDPYVSKTIFNNLFNLKTGLLIKDDLSVVLTTSKQNLEICSKMSELTQILNPPLYKIKNHTLQFHSNLHDFVNNIKVDNEDYNYLSPNVGLCSIHFLTNDMLDLCSSGLTTKPLRMELTRQKYSESFKSHVNELLSDKKFNPYLVYIKPAIPIFVLYIIATVVMAIVDNVKLVLSTNLSDYITKHINQYKDSQFVDLSEIKTRSNFSFKITIILVSVIIALSIFSAKLFALSSFTSSRKIHEYSITSLFKNSSSVIKIKKEISQMITFLSCDIFIFDASTAVFISGFLYLLIQLLVNIIILLCLIPMSIPFVLLALAPSFKNILLRIAKSSKNSQLAYLEAIVQLNSACENVITGSSIYRTFTKQPDVVVNFIEDRDYNARCKFFARFVLVWSAITFNWVFSLTTLLILSSLITLDRFTKYKLKVGYFGLALSYSMSIIKLYSRFSILYTALEMFICSVQRFRHFIPPGHKLKFDKCLNIHEEFIVNPTNKGVTVNKTQLLKRRAFEFNNDNKKFTGLRRMFYNPKIHILDVDRYLTPDHSGVEMRDVCVYTTPEHTPESMILKHVSVCAHKSEIIGMVGRTGAGKTTLLSVLQNIVENRTGQVLLDGKDLNDIPNVVLRQIIGVLPQLPFVFKGWTVRRFLDPRKLFSDPDINDALDKCGLLNFVNELQGGKKLDTVLLKERLCLSNHDKYAHYKMIQSDIESDTLLSYNQLRTLSLVRLILYRHFYRIIVVDEPPEDDLAKETRVKDDLGVPIYELLNTYFQHCTTFVTAHNVNVLKTCTSVWIIHDGSLVRTCKGGDIAANESIASIIEECAKYSK